MMHVQIAEEQDFLGTAAVSLRSALKYRRNWNKNGPTVQLLRKFMPRGSKGFRVYMPIGVNAANKTPVVPLQVRLAVKNAGFRITDYLAKKCVKLADKEQKNVFNIGKVISKDAVAKAAFDNDPQLQNSSTVEFQMVISCHPYDIIGMSTGRDWDNESCMRLADYREGWRDGVNKHYLDQDVAEGTLVAYAIRGKDTNIEKPLGRCLLKPFLHQEGDSIMYRRETRIYGNPVPGFTETLNRFLRKLNTGIPAGMYRLNEKLYNDGVGGRHEQGQSEDIGDNAVDWAVVDDAAMLQEKPHLFPSLAAYFLKNVHTGTSTADNFIWLMFSYGQHVPGKYVRQAARLMSTPDMAAAFLEHILTSEVNPVLVGQFLRNPALREAVNKLKLPSDLENQDHHALTFLNGKYAAKYYDDMPKNRDSYWNNAVYLLDGSIHLRTSDIESNPEFHKIVYVLATIMRDASVFDVEAYQESAHKLLATLKPIDTSMDITDTIEIAGILNNGSEPDDIKIAASYLLTLLKNNDLVAAQTFGAYIRPHSYYLLLNDRKIRRRLLGAKNMPVKTMEIITLQIMELLTQTHEENPATERDLIEHIKKNNLKLSTPKEYGMLLNREPELFPHVYFPANAIKAKVINELAFWLSSIDIGIDISRESTFTPINNDQKLIWDMVGTLFDISANDMHRSDGVLPHDNTEALRVIFAEGEQLENIKYMDLDLKKYPELLNKNTAHKVLPFVALADDNGAAFMAAATRGSVSNFAGIMDITFKKACTMGALLAYYDSTFKVIPDDTMYITRVSNVSKNENPREAQLLLDTSVRYTKMMHDFFNSLPEKGEGFGDRWAARLPMYSADDVNTHLIEIVGFQARIMNGLKDLIGGLKMVVYLCKKQNLDYSKIPAEWDVLSIFED